MNDLSSKFWDLAKSLSSNFNSSTFPPHILTNGNVDIMSTELFPHTIASNATLDDSDSVPPSTTPSDSFMPDIRISFKDLFPVISCIDTQRNMDLIGFLMLFSRTVLLSAAKRSDHLTHSKYRYIVLFSCVSKDFESILNCKIEST